jgi:hypothetical protein
VFVHRALGIGIQTRTPPPAPCKGGGGGEARRPIRSSHGGVRPPPPRTHDVHPDRWHSRTEQMSPPPPSSINFSFQPPTVLQELSRSRSRGGAPSLVFNDDGDDDCRNSCKGPMEGHFRARHIDFPPLTKTPGLTLSPREITGDLLHHRPGEFDDHDSRTTKTEHRLPQ